MVVAWEYEGRVQRVAQPAEAPEPPLPSLPFAAAALWEGEVPAGGGGHLAFCQVTVKWHNRVRARSQHGSFTPSTYQRCMEKSIQRGNSLFNFPSLGVTFGKVSFLLQACCPTSWRAASPWCPHRAAS